ncbi:hypothetical protein P8452_17855 [Trifolium repens]|nr:hypothetical protein P8452_17855 [Trifolium repens]
MVGEGRNNKVFRIAPGGVTPPPCIVAGECAEGEHENSMCMTILPTTPYLDALSHVPWRAGDEKIKVFGIAPGDVTPPPCIVVGECAEGEHENSMCRTILPTTPYLDTLSHVSWRAGVEKIKCSELHREVSRHLLVSWYERVHKENMKIPCVGQICPRHRIFALSHVPWRAGDEKIKLFGIAPGGVTPPPCIVVGEYEQGEHENSMCRTILPTAPYLDALSHMPWWARVEKIKCSELHLEVSRHLLVSWQESVQKENMKIPCVGQFCPRHRIFALSHVPWRAGVEKIKVFRIAPGGVTPPPCIVV